MSIYTPLGNIYDCRLCDLVLTPGRERLTFQRTKTGKPVTSPLTAFAVQELKEYPKWRGNLEDREGPLFLTHLKNRKRQPSNALIKR